MNRQLCKVPMSRWSRSEPGERRRCWFRRYAALLLSTVCLVSTSACRDGTSEESNGDTSSSMEGVVLTLLVPRELELAGRWRIPVSEWEADTGASCNVREYDAETVSDNTAELTSRPALVVCPLGLVPQLHQDSRLVPIPADLSGGWQDVFDGLRKGIGSPGGEPTVYPLSTPPLICFYRSDLLELAGLNPPATWAEYRDLLATVGEWAPGHTVVEPWGAEFRATMFLQRSAGYALHPDNFSFTLNVSTGEPLIDQPPFVRALEEIREDLLHLDPTSLSMGPTECGRQVLQGRAALAIGMLPEQDTRSGNDSTMQVGISRLPGAEEVFHSQEQSWSDVSSSGGNSVTVIGPDAWVVCVVGYEHLEAGRHAWELWNAIDTLEGRGAGSSTVLRRNSRPSDFSRTTGFGIAGPGSDAQDRYIAAVTSSLRSSRVVAELPLPGHARFRDLMRQRLTEVLEDGSAPADALQTLAGDWRQLTNESESLSVLNTYRWCRGLSPLPGN